MPTIDRHWINCLQATQTNYMHFINRIKMSLFNIIIYHVLFEYIAIFAALML